MRIDATMPVGCAMAMVSRCWAFVGGFVLLAVMGVTVVSVILRSTLGVPVPGDFELAAHGTAVAVFAFLPHCQVTGSHVAITAFTEKLPAVARSWLDGLASLLFAMIAAVLAWRAWVGVGELRQWGEVTMILGLPIWWGLASTIPSLGLLVLVNLYSAWRHAAGPMEPL